MDIFAGIMIPFIGTAAGAGCVFFLRGNLNPSIQKMLLGFASGVMVAASVWSLLIPAMDCLLYTSNRSRRVPDYKLYKTRV